MSSTQSLRHTVGISIAIPLAIPLAASLAAGLISPGPVGAQERPFPGGDDPARWEAVAETVTIYRDTWGVPHIYGPTDASVMFGAAYARAEDRIVEDEAFYMASSGRSAELNGEAGIESALRVRSVRREQVAREEYRSAPPEVRALAEAFAAGYNYYLWTQPDAPRWSVLTHLEPWQVFAFHRFDPAPDFSTPAEQQVFRPMPLPGSTRGSNAWALGPGRTATGNTMLFANPHMAFNVPYEFHVHSDEGLVISGITGYSHSGLPVMGRTEVLGWTHTVNYVDVLDVYRLEVDDAEDPKSYTHGDRQRALEVWTESVRVRTEDGFEDRSFTLRRSHHGPIRRGADGEWYAIAAANVDGPGTFEQYYRMAKARSLEEFRAALSMRRLAYHNTVYADADGNIFYVYTGAVPERSAGIDPSRVLDGTDPATDWGETLPLESLPQVLNPTSGWIQNANSSPFWATEGPENPDPTEFPHYLTGETHWLAATSPIIDADGNGARARRSRQILSSSEGITLDRFAELAMDRHYLAADERLPGLFDEWERFRSAEPDRAEPLAQPIAILREWDRRGAAGSVETTLFTEWLLNVLRPPVPAEWPLAAELAAAVDSLDARHGTWRTPWGDWNRHQKPDDRAGESFSDDRPSLPLQGGDANLTGSIYTTSAQPAPGQANRYGMFGNTYVAVMEFTPRRAAGLLDRSVRSE